MTNEQVKAAARRLCECETSVTSVFMCCDNVTKNKMQEVQSLFDKSSHSFNSFSIYIYVCVCIYVYIYIFMCVCVYIYIALKEG